MNATEIKKELDTLGRGRAELESTREQHAAELNKVLGAADYRPGEADNARRALSRVEERLRRVDERRAALEAQLPSPGEVAEAEAEIGTLIKTAEKKRKVVQEKWPAFLDALCRAEDAARELDAARSDATTAALKAGDLAKKFGLDVAVPQRPTLPRNEAKFAFVLALWLKDIPDGSPGVTAERDLNAARLPERRETSRAGSAR